MSDSRHSIPQEWVWTQLGEIKLDESRSIVPSQFDNQMFELYSVPSFETGKPEIVLGSEIGSNKKTVKEDSVLLCKINPRINRVWIVQNFSRYDKIASTEWIPFYKIEGVYPKFLLYFMQHQPFREFLASNVSGVGGSLMRVTPSRITNYPFPLPPFPEQHRIVTKIEELFTQLDAGVASLRKAQAQLKYYRQAVLKAAFEGRLTEVWRGEHKEEIEQADNLIKRIAEGKLKGKKKSSSTQFDGSDYIAQLPDKWSHASIDQISEKIVDCPHSTPKYGDGDCLCVDTTCIEPMKIIIEKLRRVDRTTFDERNRRLIPQEGDIVFAREGTIGTAVLLPETPSVCLGQRVMLIRASKQMNPKYICYSIMSPQIQNSYKSKMLGSTVAHINVGDVINFSIPIASKIEQDLIVSEIERHFSQIDHIETAITTSLRQAESLRQSILKQAFEGRLVPQDPSDEPASVLLERIRAERAQQQTKTKSPKTAKRKIKNAR